MGNLVLFFQAVDIQVLQRKRSAFDGLINSCIVSAGALGPMRGFRVNGKVMPKGRDTCALGREEGNAISSSLGASERRKEEERTSVWCCVRKKRPERRVCLMRN